MPAVPGLRHLPRHVLERQVDAVKARLAHKLHELQILMEESHLHAFRGVEGEMAELFFVLEDKAQKTLDVRLLEKKVVLIDPEMVDAVAMIFLTDLIECVLRAAEPNLE